MKLKAILQSIHEDVELSSPEELAKAFKLIVRAQEMTASEQDVIATAFKHGPLHDGEVPSKVARDALLTEGLIAKVIVKGVDGFNALTYRGAQVYQILHAIKATSSN